MEAGTQGPHFCFTPRFGSYLMNIGKALKTVRSAKDLSLESVAERSGISISYLSRIERDQRQATMPLVAKIAEALAVPVAILVFLASDAEELKGLDKNTERRFSELALDLIRQS